MNSPTISAVITTYNRPDKLLRCLQAIQAQTSPPLDTIIVHDGSSADYAECIAFIASESSMTWIDQPNQGVSAARNNGARMAKGEFIAFCDDDDYWLPNHTATLRQEIAKQEETPGIYHTFRRELTESTMTNPPIHTKPKDINWQEHYITQGEMILCCTCIHRDVATFSPFPEGVTYAEDHEQRLVALSRFPCFPIHLRTVVIDRTEESATNRSMSEITPIYRSRLKALFAHPNIAPHIRRKYQAKAMFRWTSLELSECRQTNPQEFYALWLKAAQHVRSASNLKTWMLQMMWHLQRPST